MNLLKLSLILIIASVPWVAQAGNISGDMTKWSPITIDFTGPTASETDNTPNPFLDYRLSVAFTSPNGDMLTVPGFFAGDGNGGASGNIWRVRFAADQVGQWRYQASLSSGTSIAIDTDLSSGASVSIDGNNGEFTVATQSSDAPGFLAHGRLEYTGEHYLKFRDGPYWIKAGTDSPENFLGYKGIDGTVDQGGSNFLHDYISHRGDARSDDPFFSNSSSGEDSLGITGALNYLSDKGVNSIYFLPMNLGGDGQETYPFVGGDKTTFNKTHYDISKMHQWNQVLAHAQLRGIALNIQLSETEVENEQWLDDGNLGIERKLFFRELIARFGYLLAAKWNLGEENDFAVSELRAHASYIKSLDWTQKPIAVHTQINNFRDYEELVGDELFSASSIQYDPELADEFVETWRKRSADAGRPWVIDMDENTGGISDTNADTRRKQILYDVYFSGGNLEWYYGYHELPLGGDLTAGDFRQREAMWEMMNYARTFMETQLPFWRMEPADELVSGEADTFFGNAEVFAALGEIYAVYLPNASGNPSLDLSSATGSFSLQWFNPRNGQFTGDTQTINGGERISLGSPPSSSNDDWVVLVKSHNAQALPNFTVNAESSVVDINNATDEQAADDASSNTSNTVDSVESSETNEAPYFLNIGDLPAAIPGNLYSLTVIATDNDGIAPVVTAETLPPGMKFSRVADGAATIEWQVPTDITEAATFELLAIDVRDANLRTTLNITIAITNPTAESTPEVDTSADAETEAEAEAHAGCSGVVDDTYADATTEINTALDNIDLPPIIFGIGDHRIAVGQTIHTTILPVDPEGIVAALKLDSDLQNAELIDNGNGSRDFIWTPTDSDIGTHQVWFIATDSGATPHVVQQVMTIEVVTDSTLADIIDIEDGVNIEPFFVPVDDQEITAGDTLRLTIKPIDPDGNPPILHVIAPPEGAEFNDSGDGFRTFVWSVPEEATGSVILQFRATDSDNLDVSVQQNITIKILP